MVAPPSPAIAVAGDDHNSKRCQILDGARAVFLNLGFDGASMGEIARAAGVSKGTLYVYFADKNRLFEAIVEQESTELGMLGIKFDLEGEVDTVLPNFGQAYIEVLCRPRGGSAIRTVMSIAERMPELGRGYYQRVIAHTVGRLASYLRTQVDAGVLNIDDCDFAASQFMMCCQASLFLPFIFQAAPAPSAERIAEVVGSATKMFLATYQARAS
jgi:AcrR family transcriptional regulator